MMRRIVIALLITGSLNLFSGCEEKTNPLCGGSNPATDLPWLKQEISRLSTLNGCNSISRSTYKKETVFIFSNCEPNANSIPFLYRCDGTRLNLGPSDYQDLKFTGGIELIWKSN